MTTTRVRLPRIPNTVQHTNTTTVDHKHCYHKYHHHKYHLEVQDLIIEYTTTTTNETRIANPSSILTRASLKPFPSSYSSTIQPVDPLPLSAAVRVHPWPGDGASLTGDTHSTIERAKGKKRKEETRRGETKRETETVTTKRNSRKPL
jgi:hypothetical protein